MKPKKKNYLATLLAESEAMANGAAPAARVVEVTRLKNGRVKRREIDPETDRREAARNLAARSDVARLRQSLNLSQVAFARRLEISLSTLRKWESLATVPSGPAAALLKIVSARPEVMELLGDGNKAEKVPA